jgi:Rrf2 family protein
MLRLSKKADYALLAMRHLTAHASQGSVSARELAEAYDIPPELLAKVLQQLARARLLESHQGIRGGYGLARTPESISVADVIQAIDGPLTVTACSDTDHSCDQYQKCNIRDPLWRIKDRIIAALAATSVVELAADMTQAPAANPSGAVPVAMLKSRPGVQETA